MQVPDKKTQVLPSELAQSINKVWRWLYGDDPSLATVAILLSHWALETGHGRAMHGYNVGNIKAVDDRGAWCTFGCTEVIGGKVVKLPAGSKGSKFKAYVCLDAGVADYILTLHKQYPAALEAAIRGDTLEFSKSLKAAKYYTAKESEYTRIMVALFPGYLKSL